MPIEQSLAAAKNHIEAQKMMTEVEQQRIAEMIQMELTEQGFPCHIQPDGTYRVVGMKIQRLRIVSDVNLTDGRQQQFDELKEKYAKEYGKIRRGQMKDERKKLKKQMKNEKRGKK